MSDPGYRATARSAVSPADAAFEGFTLARREPVALLVWAGLILALAVFNGVVMTVLAGPAMGELQSLQAMRTAPGATPPNPAAVFGAMGSLIPTYLVIMVVSLLFYAVMNAAILRAVFRPQDRAAGYLRFGAQELRQLAVLVLVGLIFMAAYLVVVAVTALLAVVLGVSAAGAAGNAASPNVAVIGVMVLVELLLVVLALAAMVVLGVRLSLASALTFAQGRVRVFGSWALTRRRFWPILGAYVLAGVVLAVIFVVLMAVFGGVAMATGGAAQAGFMFHPNMTSLATYFSGLQIAYLVVSAPLSALWMATQAGVPARIYTQVAGSGNVADVFGTEASPENRSTSFGATP